MVEPDLSALRAMILTRLTPDMTAPQTGIAHRIVPAGTVLFEAGQHRDFAYLIDSGEIHILDRQKKLLCRLGPGEVFGEMALIDDGLRSASAVSAMHSEVYVIPRTAIQHRIAGLDPLLSLLIGLLVERYRLARKILPESIREDQIGDLASQKINQGWVVPQGVAGASEIKVQKDIALKELRLEQELRRGVERHEFIPVLQPILHLPQRTLAGFEALVRWQHPEKGLLAPDSFIPVAERTGTIQLLDQMMLHNICALAPQFLQGGTVEDDFFISVNLSGINFETLDMLDWVREALIESEMPAKHLKLEITESALIVDPVKAEQILHGVKALGVGIALDDFGTGYSSLGYLRRFPIDSLKIDRSFVARLQDEPKTIDIVRAIVGLARNFRLGVIAEGIETEDDVALLNTLGCDMGQGYLFGKPMPDEAALEFMRKNLAA